MSQSFPVFSRKNYSDKYLIRHHLTTGFVTSDKLKYIAAHIKTYLNEYKHISFELSSDQKVNSNIFYLTHEEKVKLVSFLPQKVKIRNTVYVSKKVGGDFKLLIDETGSFFFCDSLSELAKEVSPKYYVNFNKKEPGYLGLTSDEQKEFIENLPLED